MTGLYLPFFAGLVFIAALMSGVFGMAGGMVLMGGLLLFLPVPAVMVLHGIAQVTSNVWRTALWHQHVRWSLVRRFAAGAAVSIAMFWLIRYVPDERIVMIGLGLTPYIALATPKHIVPQADSRFGSELCGAICTAFQIFSGLSGPLLDLFFVHSRMDRRTVISTKAACQVLSNLGKLSYFGALVSSAADALSPLVLLLAIVPAIAGTMASKPVILHLTDHQFRYWTKLVVVGLGTIFLIRGILGFMELPTP